MGTSGGYEETAPEGAPPEEAPAPGPAEALPGGEDVCPDCDGSGVVAAGVCDTCGGSGWIQASSS